MAAAVIYRVASRIDRIIFTADAWKELLAGAGKEILSLLCWFGFFYLFFAVGGMGAGDVKLYMVCLLFLNTSAAFSFVFYSMSIGLVFYLVKYLVSRKRKKECPKHIRLAGPMLLGACLQFL